MFEHKVAEKAQYDEQLVEFVNLYARFLEDAGKASEMINAGKITDQERIRMHKFEARVDEAWQAIPEAKREILTSALLAKNLLPQEVEAALRIFKGKIIQLH